MIASSRSSIARAARSRLSRSVYCLVMSWLPMRWFFSSPALTQFLAQVEDEVVEQLRRHADDDGAAHLAVGQLVAVDGGDERPLGGIHQLQDGGDGTVERVDLELELAGADDDAAGDCVGSGSFFWVSACGVAGLCPSFPVRPNTSFRVSARASAPPVSDCTEILFPLAVIVGVAPVVGFVARGKVKLVPSPARSPMALFSASIACLLNVLIIAGLEEVCAQIGQRAVVGVAPIKVFVFGHLVCPAGTSGSERVIVIRPSRWWIHRHYAGSRWLQPGSP